MIVSADLLARAGAANPAAWSGPMTAACLAQSIVSPRRLAGFLANVLHETMGLQRLTESLDYSAQGLLATFGSHFTSADAQRMGRTAARPADQRAIAERVYGGRFGNRAEGSGDGFLYRGHGGLQTTFFANYLALAHAIGWARPVEALPAYLATADGACSSAAIFWRRGGCNELMDAGAIIRARIVINGGTNGMAEVQARYQLLNHLVGAAGAAPQPTPSPAESVADALDDRFNPAS